MKKLMVSLLAVLGMATYSVNAQSLWEGNWLMNGTVNVNSDFDNMHGLGLGVSGEYLFSDNWSFGLGINYRGAYGDGRQTVINGINAMPYVKYYVDIAPRFYFDILGGINVGYTNFNPKVGDSYYAMNYGVDIIPGITYLVNNSLVLTANFGGLGWNMESPEEGDATHNFGLSWNNGFNFGIGFRF